MSMAVLAAVAGLAMGPMWAGGCSGGVRSGEPRGPGGGASGPRARVEEGRPTISVSAAEVARYRDPLESSRLRERALDVLMEATRDPYDLARASALEGLGLTPGRLVEPARAGLKDRNPGVRSASAMMVGKARLGALLDEVRPLLRDSDARVRASAIFALHANGAAVDPTPLAGMVLADPSPRARAQAAFVLGEMGDRSAIGLLNDAARRAVGRATASETRILQIQIAEAMVKLGDEKQLEVIRAALYPSRPEDLEVAALAVQVIGQLRDRGAIDNLVYLTAVRDERGNRMPAEVRLGAAAALARMGMGQGSFLADEFAGHPSAALRAQAAFVYGEIGRVENLAKLEVMMRDADASVRVAAAAAVVRVTSGQIPNIDG